MFFHYIGKVVDVDVWINFVSFIQPIKYTKGQLHLKINALKEFFFVIYK